MERTKVEALTDDFLDIIIDDNGIRILGTAMQYTMTDRRDLINALNNADFRVDQGFQHLLYRDLMVRQIGFIDIIRLAIDLMGQKGSVDTDSLAQAFGQYGFIFHIDQLIFQRRTATVDN